jgi:hypothetical protein
LALGTVGIPPIRHSPLLSTFTTVELSAAVPKYELGTNTPSKNSSAELRLAFAGNDAAIKCQL